MKIGVIVGILLMAIAAPVQASDCDVLKFNRCISCEEPLAFEVAQLSDCQNYCPNREASLYFYDKTIFCVLKNCPLNRPYRSEKGSCYASSAEAKQAVEDAIDNTNSENEQESEWQHAPFAVGGKCPEDKPLLYSGKCFSCQESRDFSIDKEYCDKCSNRVYKEYSHWGVAVCSLKCPTDKPLQRWDGKCFSCDEEKAVRLPTHCNLENDCEDWCKNRTILYDVGGNVPSIPNCPENKPLPDSAGICHACDETADILVNYNESLCEKICPAQRYSDGPYCKIRQPGA